MKIFRKTVSFLLMAILVCTMMAVPAMAADSPLVQGIGFVTATGLNLRSAPNTTASALATAFQNECVVILEQQGDWCKVNYNLQEGYMYSSFLQISNTENAELGYGEVIGAGVNLRQEPSTFSAVLATEAQGTRCYILGLNQGWYKVICGDTIGYIRSDFIKLTEIPYENNASANTPKFFRHGVSTGAVPSAAALNGSAPLPQVTASAIVSKAKEYLGTPYVYGGASPSGFDCSGFTYYVLTSLELTPGRTPVSQLSIGTPVEKNELKPGDLVFFATSYSGNASHVGIYTGSGEFIHAPNSGSCVSYSSLLSGYWADRWCGARRIASN